MKKALKISAFALIGLVLVSCLAGYLVLNNYAGKIQYEPDAPPADGAAPEVSLIPDEGGETDEASSTDSPLTQIDALEKSIRENLESDSMPLIYDNDVFNVLLVGIDTRKHSDSGNSDTMLLISINRKTSKIVATSLLRDIYLSIPGLSQGNRLNAAYSYGGPSRLLETIEENFKIQVDKYIAVNFYSFMDLIDQLGGVTLDVTGAELKVANKYIRQINKLLELPADDGVLTDPGTRELNGKQALAYSRIRYVGDGDFERTDRQRLVMEQVFKKLQGLNVFQLNDILNKYLPEVRTNLARGELITLMLSVPKYAAYELDSWHIPMKDTFSYMTIRGMSVLGIDFKQNVEEMRKRIYG